jgi:hypothetical protein
MTSIDDSGQRQEIQSSLKMIVETSEKWLGRLKRRERRARVAVSFLTTMLVFFVLGASILSILLLRYGFGYLNHLFSTPSLADTLAASIFLIGLVSGLTTFFLLRRAHRGQLNELTSLIDEMKKKLGIGDLPKSKEGEGITEDALTLADKLLTLLPEMVRKRNQDALLFGVTAFVLTTTFSGNIGIAILVGVIVWLYFRWETKKTYDQEISKLEDQKRVFDQRKNEFLETL